MEPWPGWHGSLSRDIRITLRSVATGVSERFSMTPIWKKVSDLFSNHEATDVNLVMP
jgi:hypothetical protein